MDNKKELNIISGIAFNRGGAGIFLARFCQSLESSGIKVNYYGGKAQGSLRVLLAKRDVVGVVRELVFRVRQLQKKTELPLFDLKPVPTIIFFPQGLGFRNVNKFLSKAKRQPWIFVLDNSFFCKRAYNSIPPSWAPCLKCLGGAYDNAELNACQSNDSNDIDLMELAQLQRHVSQKRVKFFAQSRTQEALLRAHYGSDTDVSVVGLPIRHSACSRRATGTKDGYDFVYHASSRWAKGVGVLLEMAVRLPQYCFLFPEPKANLLKALDALGSDNSIPENISCRNIRWQHGLAAAVESAKAILCPSVWSNPIEGAFIKSLVHNGCVVVVKEKTSFSDELPDGAVLRLDLSDLDACASELVKLMESPESRRRYRQTSLAWLQEDTLTNRHGIDRFCSFVFGR
jgi:hypothetical protein